MHALDQLDLLQSYGAISDRDSIEKKLRVLIAIFDSVEQPTADAFRRQLDIIRKYDIDP